MGKCATPYLSDLKNDRLSNQIHLLIVYQNNAEEAV